MKMSVREARAQFAAALSAAENGETVTITKNGRPVAELGPPKRKGGLDFAHIERVQRELGWDKAEIAFAPEFDDPAYGRRLFGLDP